MDPPAGFVFDEEPTMTSQQLQDGMRDLKREIARLRREVEASKGREPVRPVSRNVNSPPVPPARPRPAFDSINVRW